MPVLVALSPVIIALLQETAPSFGRLLAAALDSLTDSLTTPAAPVPVMEYLAQQAQWHVQDFEKADVSGTEKQKMALAALVDDCTREKIDVKAGDLNTLIELAHKGLPKTTTAATAAEGK